MPHFCIFDHQQMPLVRVSVESRRQDVTKDGFRLRYRLEIPESSVAHAWDVVRTIDRAMGASTKALGVYQARYADVRAAYDALMDEARADDRLDPSGPLRALALLASVALGVTWCAVVPPVAFGFLVITALKRQSGFAAMAEARIVGWIFDWRPMIKRLARYANTGEWT